MYAAVRVVGGPAPASAGAVRAAATATVLPTVAATPVAHAAKAAAPPVLTTAAGIAAARRWALKRQGTVAFAVLDQKGRLRGLNRTLRFSSASVVKAMLLVSVLRSAGSGPISSGTAATLTSMITISDNNAASAIYARVGGAGLRAVARAAGDKRFEDVGNWADAQLTAADQARFFLKIDGLVPAVHRRFARKLLSSIVGWQRWGIPPIAKDHRLKVYFKGGWRTGITHQVALLERGSERVSLAVLTSGEPSMGYGEQTISGIAARVLR